MFGFCKMNEAEWSETSGMEYRCHSIVWVFYDGKEQFFHSAQIGGTKNDGKW